MYFYLAIGLAKLIFINNYDSHNFMFLLLQTVQNYYLQTVTYLQFEIYVYVRLNRSHFSYAEFLLLTNFAV